MSADLKGDIGNYFRNRIRSFDDLLLSEIRNERELNEFVSLLFVSLFKSSSLTLSEAPRLFYKLSSIIPAVKRERVALCRVLLDSLTRGTAPQLPFELKEHALLTTDGMDVSSRGLTFELPYFIEMMAIIYAIGIRTKSEVFIACGTQMLIASLHLLDRKGALPIGVCSPPDEVNEVALKALHSTVLHSVYQMTGDTRLEEIVKKSTPIALPDQEVGFSLPSCLIEVIEEGSPHIYCPPLNFLPEHDFGCINLSDFSATLIVDCFGCSTPLGYLEMGDVEFRAFGFQYAPLGEMSTFGTCRMEREEVEDIQIVEGESVTTFRGWTRLLAPTSVANRPVPGASFAHLYIGKREGEVDIQLRVIGGDLQSKLFFTFFVKGPNVMIGESLRLEQKSLKKYSGKAGPLSVGKLLDVTPHSSGRMEVIPLEGEEHFWGADFLLAFEIDRLDQELSWSIKVI